MNEVLIQSPKIVLIFFGLLFGLNGMIRLGCFICSLLGLTY